MAGDLLDQTLLLKVGKSATSQGAVNLETIDQGGDGHETVGLDILLELLEGGLLEDDGVLGLVLDYRQKTMLVAVYSECISHLHVMSRSTIHIRSRNDSKSRLLCAVVGAGRERNGSEIVVTVGWMNRLLEDHGEVAGDDAGNGDGDGDSVPLPLLHFFFCFPAGACSE